MRSEPRVPTLSSLSQKPPGRSRCAVDRRGVAPMSCVSEGDGDVVCEGDDDASLDPQRPEVLARTQDDVAQCRAIADDGHGCTLSRKDEAILAVTGTRTRAGDEQPIASDRRDQSAVRES